jgi:tripartite-type tricarboxylate transporter receptor subunit TctC
MRPVRIIVAAPAAGATDVAARLIGQWLSERLGRPFFAENRPGGNSNIGTEAVRACAYLATNSRRSAPSPS